MTARARRRLAVVALAGVVALGSDPRITSPDEPERPPAAQPKLGAWAAHAHRVVSVKRPKPRRPDKLPPPRAPRLDVPRASTSQCANLAAIPAPDAGEVLFVANGPLVGNNAFILRYASAFNGTTPCAEANLLVSFPETALLFGEGAALILSSTSDGQTVYSFWGTEPFGTANVYFADTGPNQFGIRSGILWVVTPRTLYAAGAACPYCSLGDIPVNGSDQPNWNPLKSTAVAYNRVHNLAHADLTGATLTGTFADWDFTGANLTRANLTGAVFTSGTQLADVQFSGASLDGAVFENSDLTGASLMGARWDAARPPRFEGVRIGASDSGACTRLDGLDLLEVPVLFSIGSVSPGCESVPMFPGALLRLEVVAPYLSELDLAGADLYVDAANRSVLAGANLTGARLDGLTLVGFPADLTQTVFDGASMIGASFDLADFAGATLHGVHAAGASFRGARFGPRGSSIPAASFAGDTNLTNADFIEADVSGASFAGATLTGAVFNRVLAVGASFDGVSAENANFALAHIYGDGQAFHQATSLDGADFTGAVLAANVAQSGGFDFTQADLTGAKFDRAQCIGCNFTSATLPHASFAEAYLPGSIFAGAKLDGASLFSAWLYCGDLGNSSCQHPPGHSDEWEWTLHLGSDEAYGPVPFPQTDLTQANLTVVTACPDGKEGAVSPAGCDGHLLPERSQAPVIPSPCSAAALGSCPEPVQTLLGNSTSPRPLAVAPLTPAYWATPGATDQGLLVAFDDGTVRKLTGAGQSMLVAGSSGQVCPGPTAPCGDGGPATAARLGRPSGLAVDARGAIYIADGATRRIRRIGTDGTIQTVVGSGGPCDETGACGDGAPASAATLYAALDVWADPDGNLWIADGARGIRLVTLDGLIYTVNFTRSWNVVAVAGDVLGTLYAATRGPDHLLQITHDGALSVVVGTGTSGFNGNSDDFGLLPGPQVQINRPGGLAVTLDGTVFFADSGNHLVRGYVPASGHVVEVGGLIESGAPAGGFNGDGQPARQTKFSAPSDLAATGTGRLAVADTGNGRVRQFAR
jgi:uncharacterized protein YjbI with pentapeptide repeats